MTDHIYHRVARVLDTLPNGFPPTESGVEIRLLKKIFTPEEAELFCELRLSLETPEQIALRTGRDLPSLEKMLDAMWREKGQIFGVSLGSVKLFKLAPWAVGIYEFQVTRMDEEFVKLCDEYNEVFAGQFFRADPPIMQVIPVETALPSGHQALPYEQVSAIIEKGVSFATGECVCRKERRLLGKGCGKPADLCLAIAPVAGIFDNHHWGRSISKEEAYRLLDAAEEAALVHQTMNVREGHYFICNCCGCCCGILRAINEYNIMSATSSNFYAVIDPGVCTGCGICADERCQIRAIEEHEGAFRIIEDRCIGCGLCITTCPVKAVSLIPRAEEVRQGKPVDEKDWFRERGHRRGVDWSRYE